MRHQMRLFDDTSSEGWAMLWLITAAAGFAGAVIMGFEVGFLSLLCVIPFLLLSYGIFGHVLFDREEALVKLWKRYKALPKEYRKSIDLDAETLAGMTTAQRVELTNRVDRLETLIKSRQDAMTLPTELRTRFDAIIEREKDAIEHEKTVQKQMKELGWDS